MKQLLKLIKEHKILFIIWLILIITDISSMIEYGQDLDLQVLIYKIFIETSIIFGIGFILNSKLFSKTTDNNNTNNANSFINNANNSVTNNLPNQNYVSENNNQMEKNNHKREYKIDNIIIVIGILLMVFYIIFFIMFSLLQLFVDNKINWLKSLYTLLEHVPYLIVPFIIDGALIVLGIIIKIIKKLKK